MMEVNITLCQCFCMVRIGMDIEKWSLLTWGDGRLFIKKRRRRIDRAGRIVDTCRAAVFAKEEKEKVTKIDNQDANRDAMRLAD